MWFVIHDACEAVQPPAKYVHSASTPLNIHYISQDDVTAQCGVENNSLQPRKIYLGCVISDRATHTPIVMILPSPKTWTGTKQEYRCNYIHELGHWNGWPKDHPKE